MHYTSYIMYMYCKAYMCLKLLWRVLTISINNGTTSIRRYIYLMLLKYEFCARNTYNTVLALSRKYVVY